MGFEEDFRVIDMGIFVDLGSNSGLQLGDSDDIVKIVDFYYGW